MIAEFQKTPDEALAGQARAGLLTAFEELVYRYEKRVYGFVAHSCPNAADAQELTQDIFVRAFQAIDQFDPKYGFATWLFSIARHKCIDFYRSSRLNQVEIPEELGTEIDPGEMLARADERQGVWELARRTLPTIQFQALWLKYIEELSLIQIARSLNKSPTHVKVLLFRARRGLAREVERNRRAEREPEYRPAPQRIAFHDSAPARGGQSAT